MAAVYGAYRLARTMARVGRRIANRMANRTTRAPKSYRSRHKAKRSVRKYNRKNRRASKKQNRRDRKRGFHSANVGNPDRGYGSQSHGRKRPRRMIMNKLLNTHLSNVTYAISNFGPAYRGVGNVTLEHAQTANGAETALPLHLWEMTGAIQSNGVAMVAPVIFYKLGLTSETAAAGVVWRGALNGANPVDQITTTNPVRAVAGSDSNYTPQRIFTDSTFDLTQAQSGPGARGFLGSVGFKLLLNSPQTKGCTFVIQMVQLHENVVPGATPTVETTSFWQAMTKPYAYSPLADGLHEKHRKYIKILKSTTVHLDAPESVEDHVISRTKLLRLYFNMNRALNFKWGIATATQNMENNTLITDMSALEFVTHVEPKARVFLMIRAQAEQALAYDALTHPSYDIVMKTYHKRIAE